MLILDWIFFDTNAFRVEFSETIEFYILGQLRKSPNKYDFHTLFCGWNEYFNKPTAFKKDTVHCFLCLGKVWYENAFEQCDKQDAGKLEDSFRHPKEFKMRWTLKASNLKLVMVKTQVNEIWCNNVQQIPFSAWISNHWKPLIKYLSQREYLRKIIWNLMRQGPLSTGMTKKSYRYQRQRGSRTKFFGIVGKKVMMKNCDNPVKYSFSMPETLRNKKEPPLEFFHGDKKIDILPW